MLLAGQRRRSVTETGTLTEAYARGQVRLAMGPRNGSNVRTIPYADIYRESNVDRETPAERVQRIAMGEGDAKSTESPT